MKMHTHTHTDSCTHVQLKNGISTIAI